MSEDFRPGDLVLWKGTKKNKNSVHGIGLVIGIDPTRDYFTVTVFWPNAVERGHKFDQHPFNVLRVMNDR